MHRLAVIGRILNERLPSDLHWHILRQLAAMRLQKFYKRWFVTRYRRNKLWVRMENLIVQHSSIAVLERLRSIPRVRMEWQTEMDSWISMLEAPDAPQVLDVILQEVENGFWSWGCQL